MRSTSRVLIQVNRSNHVPGFHSCLAPTPATHLFTASRGMPCHHLVPKGALRDLGLCGGTPLAFFVAAGTALRLVRPTCSFVS